MAIAATSASNTTTTERITPKVTTTGWTLDENLTSAPRKAVVSVQNCIPRHAVASPRTQVVMHSRSLRATGLVRWRASMASIAAIASGLKYKEGQRRSDQRSEGRRRGASAVALSILDPTRSFRDHTTETTPRGGRATTRIHRELLRVATCDRWQRPPKCNQNVYAWAAVHLAQRLVSHNPSSPRVVACLS